MKSIVSFILIIAVLTACNNGAKKEAELQRAKQAAIDSMKMVMEKEAIIDSMQLLMAEQEEKVKETEERNTQVVATSTAQPVKKKKWSNAGKGAVIGAGTGAIAGALINKKRGEGALVGGLIGAGVGAGTGAIIDGSKKKKQAQ